MAESARESSRSARLQPTWTIYHGQTEYAVVMCLDGRPDIVSVSAAAQIDGFADALANDELSVWHPMRGILSIKCEGTLLDVSVWLDQYVQEKRDLAVWLEGDGVDLSPFLPSVPDGDVA